MKIRASCAKLSDEVVFMQSITMDTNKQELPQAAQPADTRNTLSDSELTDDERIDSAAKGILNRFKPAFQELAR